MIVPSFPDSNTSITMITRPGMADFQGRDWLPLIVLPLSASFFIIRADFRYSGAGLNPVYAILFYFILPVSAWHLQEQHTACRPSRGLTAATDAGYFSYP